MTFAIFLLVIAVLLLIARLVVGRLAKRVSTTTTQVMRDDPTDKSAQYGGTPRRIPVEPPQFTTASTPVYPNIPVTRLPLSIATSVFAVLAAVVLLFSSIAIVGTKEDGIVTAFNRPVGVLDNGIHLIKPWESVTEMDAAIQTDNDLAANKPADCVETRIAHQIIACVDVTIRWRIYERAADSLFQNYRDFSNVRVSLVTRELATDVNNVFQDYDPLAVDNSGNSTSPELSSLAATVLTEMQNEIGGQIQVLSVFIPVMHFSTAVQDRINALQSQIAATRIQNQAILTAQAQAAANRALATSVSTDPNVLVSKCFDILSAMVTAHQSIPAGFSCWPGGSTGVVIPASRG